MSISPAQAIDAAKRITIKIGSSLLTSPIGANADRFNSIADEVAKLGVGRKLILVSSGAVALGRVRIGGRQQSALAAKQAAAAIGQPLLMQAWRQALGKHGIESAQLLLSIGDTESRHRWLNARATVEQLFAAGVVPVVNENDSVATAELRYGDNDRLSARVAQMVGADLLILLSDVDGLYSANPVDTPDARHVGSVSHIDDELLATAGGAADGGVGTGGMRTKLEAARLAQGFGCSTIIASGKVDRPITAIVEGTAQATIVPARESTATAYKAWIAASLSPGGIVTIDQGAVEALRRGSSLLPSGVVAVSGDFMQGDTVKVVDDMGRDIALGLARYTAGEARQIAGSRASQFEARLGYSRGDELVHRDDMVLR